MATVPSFKRSTPTEDSNSKRPKALSPALEDAESDVPIKQRSVAGTAVPPQEFMDQFSQSIRYRTLLRLFADLTGNVAKILDGGNVVNWPELTAAMRQRYHVSPPASMLLEDDNLHLLYKELQWSNRVDTAAIQAHRDYTTASEAKRLSLALLTKFHQWVKLEDNEGRRAKFQMYKEAFQKTNRDDTTLIDLTNELSEVLRTYFDQGVHKRFPDVAKAYIPYFQNMYRQFGIRFPVSKEISEIPVADTGAGLVPSSPPKAQQINSETAEAVPPVEQPVETGEALVAPSVDEENSATVVANNDVPFDQIEIPLVPESVISPKEKVASPLALPHSHKETTELNLNFDDSAIPEPVPADQLEAELGVGSVKSAGDESSASANQQEKEPEAKAPVQLATTSKGRPARKAVQSKSIPLPRKYTRKNSKNLQEMFTERESSARESIDKISGSLTEQSDAADAAIISSGEAAELDKPVEDEEERKRRVAPLVAMVARHLEQEKSAVPKEVMAASLQAMKVYLTLTPPTDLVDYDPFKLSFALKNKDYTECVRKVKSISRFADPSAGLKCDTPEEQNAVSLMGLNALAFNSFDIPVSEHSRQLVSFYQTYQKGIKRVSQILKSDNAAEQIATLRQQRTSELSARGSTVVERPPVSSKPERIKLSVSGLPPKPLPVKAAPTLVRKKKASTPQTPVVAASSRPARAVKAAKLPAVLLKKKKKQQ